MVFHIAQRGRESMTPRKEMLIDAQHSRTPGTSSFRSQSFQHVLKPALNRCAAQAFALA